MARWLSAARPAPSGRSTSPPGWSPRSGPDDEAALVEHLAAVPRAAAEADSLLAVAAIVARRRPRAEPWRPAATPPARRPRRSHRRPRRHRAPARRVRRVVRGGGWRRPPPSSLARRRDARRPAARSTARPVVVRPPRRRASTPTAVRGARRRRLARRADRERASTPTSPTPSGSRRPAAATASASPGPAPSARTSDGRGRRAAPRSALARRAEHAAAVWVTDPGRRHHPRHRGTACTLLPAASSARRERARGRPCRRDRTMPPLSPLLPGQADVVQPLAGPLVQPGGRHHASTRLQIAVIDDLLAGQRVDAAVGERRAHHGQVFAVTISEHCRVYTSVASSGSK